MTIDQNAMSLLTFVVAVAAYVAAVSLLIQQRIGDLKRTLRKTHPDTDIKPAEVDADICWKRFQITLLSLGEIPLFISAVYLTCCTLLWSPGWVRLGWPEQVVRRMIAGAVIYLVVIHIVGVVGFFLGVRKGNRTPRRLPISVHPYTLAKGNNQLPAANNHPHTLTMVSDPAAGKSALVMSDGTNWKYADGTAVAIA